MCLISIHALCVKMIVEQYEHNILSLLISAHKINFCSMSISKHLTTIAYISMKN